MPSFPARARHLALAAFALLALLPSAAAAAVGTTPIPSGYVTDGVVHASATDSAGRLYIGGEFQSVGPLTGSSWSADPATGDRTGNFPQTDGTINAIEFDGVAGWYIGGSFSTVGGVKRQNAAHVFSDGSVDKDWNPSPNGPVNAIALTSGWIYIGGTFSEVGGKPRSRLARVSQGNANIDTSWIANANATSVDVLETSGSQLYVGGTSLSSVAGKPCANVCRLTIVGWDVDSVDTTWQPIGVNGAVRAIAVDGNSVYIGGRFTFVEGTLRVGVAKLSATSAALDATWDPDTDATTVNGIRALKVIGSKLYLGGDFALVDGAAIAGLARVSTTGTGDVDTTWTPEIQAPVHAIASVSSTSIYVGGDFTSVGTTTRRHAARLSIAPGSDAVLEAWNPVLNNTVNAIGLVPGSNVLLGGWFTSGGAKNLERQNVARFDSLGRLDTTWNPRAGSRVNALATAGDSVYIGGLIDTVGGHGTASQVVKVSQNGVGAHDTAWAPTNGGGGTEVLALATSGGNVYIGRGVRALDDMFSTDTLVKVSGSGTGAEDTAWNPNIDGAIRALLVSGTDLYVGGDFQSVSIGGSTRSYLAKLSTTGTGAANATWDPQPDDRVFALALANGGGDLFLGGEFQNVGAAARTYAAKVSTAGAGTPNTAWAPDLNNTVRALAVADDQVYVGGTFTVAAGEYVRRLARFSVHQKGAIDQAFKPDPILPVNTLLATSSRVVAGGQFPSISGRDGAGVAIFDITAPTITLNLPRDAGGNVFTRGTAPKVSFTCQDDGGAAAVCLGSQENGSTLDMSLNYHQFTVIATDESGNTTTKKTEYSVVDPPKTDSGQPEPTTPVGGQQPAPTPAGNAPVPGASSTAKDLVAPLISKPGLSPKSFKAAKSGASTVIPKPGKNGKLGKPKTGTRITLALSEAATVQGTVVVPAKGKTKAKTVGSFTQPLTTGSPSVDFTGRIAGKKLKPGKYSLELVATDAAGNASKVTALSFTIKR